MSGGAGVVGVILAGGRSRRMGGGDKFLRQLGGRPLLDHVVGRARPQVDELIINATGAADRFAAYRLAVVADVVGGFAGPLAGILTALDWAAEHQPGADWVASFAADAPFFPADLVDTMRAATRSSGADLACAVSGGRTHPVFGLWPLRLRRALRSALIDEDVRKIDQWTARYAVEHVDFAVGAVDPFFNVNRPEDLAAAESLLARVPA